MRSHLIMIAIIIALLCAAYYGIPVLMAYVVAIGVAG